MNAHDFYSAFVRTAQESTLVTKEMVPSFPEAWGTATFLDLYRNNEPAYTELVNKYIVHKIIKDAGMTAQHEYFRIDGRLDNTLSGDAGSSASFTVKAERASVGFGDCR